MRSGMRKIGICLLAALMGITGWACAEPGAGEFAPEYRSITAQVQTLADPDTWLKAIAPDGAEVETVREQRGMDYYVTVLSGEGFSIEYDDNGSFRIEVDSGIPTRYRGEGEGEYAPLPSDEEGRYTRAEAEALALNFLEETVGMDVSQLAVRSAYAEDAAKARSRGYEFGFGYRFEGIDITHVPGIWVAVNDDGVVRASGELALSFSGGDRVGDAKLLTEDELISGKGDQWVAPVRIPVYTFIDFDDIRIAWLFTENSEAGDIIWNSTEEYDMQTGEKLPAERAYGW